jgi:HEPN domain-containing protein
MCLVPYEGPEDETGNSNQGTASREPATLEEAKREVAEALKEIWQLPESERSSAIKRLIRRWHPDKNQHRESFANEVTKFLFNEVERLKKGGIPGYRPEADNSNQSSREPSRPTSDYPKGTSTGSTWRDAPDFDAFFTRCRGRARQRQRHRERRDADNENEPANKNENEPANKNEAARWMRQAQDDLDAARCLFRSKHYSLACFQCQQAVEKALKALMFAKGRLKKSDLEDHEVMTLAYRATRLDPRLREISGTVARIQGYYTNTRYPRYQRGFFQTSIPAEMFSQGDADDAISKAAEILQLLRQVLN